MNGPNSKTIQASPEAPGEGLGLLANGSSGSWEVSIDETVVGKERWFAQVEGPSLWLYFEIPSPEIIPRAIQFLLPRGTKKEVMPGCFSRSSDRLDIGVAGETLVCLVKDDEYQDRYYFALGPGDSPIVRYSVAGEDRDNLVEALREVEEDIEPSGQEADDIVEHESSDRTIWMPRGAADYVSLWSFAGEKLRLASRLLNFMCAHDFTNLRIKKKDSQFLTDKKTRSRWNVRSPYVRDIAVRLLVDPASLRTFLEQQGFNPARTVNPPAVQRDRWIEKRWDSWI